MLMCYKGLARLQNVCVICINGRPDRIGRVFSDRRPGMRFDWSRRCAGPATLIVGGRLNKEPRRRSTAR